VSAPAASSRVTLREVTADTVRAICNLSVGPGQQGYVAPNAVSIAQAHFAPHAWFRAIYADETPVGFLMLSDKPEESEYFLWRFMMDARYQGLGFGVRAIGLLVAHVRGRPGARQLVTSTVPGPRNPRPFYESLGFSFRGDIREGEEVLVLPLEDRLVLRQVTDRDLPTLFEHQSDPDSVRMAAFPARDWDAFRAHWDKIRTEPASRTWAVVRDGQLAGQVLSFERFGLREVGYWLGREHWGQGVATRAVAAFLAGETHRPLVARVAEHNRGSLRVLAKSGFRVTEDPDPGPPPEDGVKEIFLELTS